ncbi:SdrD B-like domain-containing protein [Ramlibacter sp. 2FC]|uniref:SdrD B-like domain-containing protein n=1 Tax=Ramlibacter sp. 2FC TaxID=2502188 RepID=UPI0010F5BF09|nr:SdrD B-like domain-containing protein [Ramlibacter sp. 2FC]
MDLACAAARRHGLGAFVFALALFLMSSETLALTPAAGSLIENRALLSYVDTATGLAARLESNTVRVEVMAVAALALSADQSVRHPPGGLFTLAHRLRNTGNAEAAVRLSASGAPTGTRLRIVRDDNANGRADAGEPELGPDDPLVLAAGAAADLLLLGQVPGTAAPEQRIALQLRAQAGDAEALNTDTVTVTQGAALRLWKAALERQTAPGARLGFRITASNTGSAAATGLPVAVDGTARELLLIGDMLPANTQLLEVDGGAATAGMALYHLRGEPPASFVSALPADAATVDQVAWAIEQLPPGHTLAFELGLRVQANASGVVSNQAVARFGSPDGPQESLSNRATVPLPLQPPVLSFFRDSGFATPSTVAARGDTLYVQADAAACNRDAAVAEQVALTLRSALTGDSETFIALESAPNSGLFRIARGMATADSGAAVSGDGWLAVRPNDRISGQLAGCGAARTEAGVLIDPYGVVYDSKSNAPLAGVRVTLIDVSGAGNGGLAGASARVFAADGVTPAPASVLSDAQGRYAFPLVPASLYRLQVEPVEGYAFPSALPPPLQPGDRVVNAAASYGGAFVVDERTGAVRADLPLDAPLALGLRVRKQAARARVERGDFIDYTVEVRNASGAALGGVQLRDTLPPGFAYVPGSTRREGQPVPDPVVREGMLVYALGSLATQAGTTLVYRLRVTPWARAGAATNRAQAASAPPLAAGSNVASATVKVDGGVFSAQGYLLGRVFADCNANGLADAGEPGVAGVRLWLETGDSAVTDAEGRYHFDDLLPLTHVLKLDAQTLPPGFSPGATEGRGGGPAGSRFVDLHNGELRRADLALRPEHGCGAAPAAPASGPAAVGRPASQASRLPPLPSLLPALEPVPVLLWPHDGAVLAGRQTAVRVAGPALGRLELSVNGQPVAASRIGTRSEDLARGVRALEYIGVDLQPGGNRLRLRWLDELGIARGQQEVGVTAPGPLAHMELGVPEQPVAGQALTLRLRLLDAAGLLVAARSAVTLQASAGRWQVDDLDPALAEVQTFVEGGEALLTLLAPERPGTLALRASAGTVQAAQELALAPALRPLVAAGIVEGVLDLSRLRGIEAATEADGFERELRAFGSDALRGRAALFLKGKVKGETLLTLAYDSEKPRREGLFRDVQSERYYPVYGDDARRGFEAASSGRLFVRVDRGASFALYGDFHTAPPGGAPGGPALARYSRSLTGLKQHHESPGLKFDAWASQARSRQVVDELPATGTSGPFYLRVAGVVAGSERVELLVRDRNQPATVLRSTPLTAFVDYDLEAESGRLLLRAPQASLDAELNPVSLRITYESEQGGPGFWVWGGDAELEALPGLRLGASLAQDEDPRSPYRLAGLRAAWQLAAATTLRAELAASHRAQAAPGEAGSGEAARIEIEHRDGALAAKAMLGRAEPGFDNPGAPLNRGREEASAQASYALDARTRLSAEALRSADTASGARRTGLRASAEHDLGGGLRVEGGLRVAQETAAPAQPGSVGGADFTSLRARLSSPLPGWPAVSVYGEAEQAVAGSGAMRAVGGEMRLADRGRLYARHEFINSFSGIYGLNETQQRRSSVLGFERDDGQGLRLFGEFRGRDWGGQEGAEAAIGLRKLWTVAEGLRVGGGFERVKGLEGSSRNEVLALSGSAQWTARPGLTLNGRLEWRDAPLHQSWFGSAGLAWKLDESWRLLGRASLDQVQPRDGSTGPRRERLQGGLAWREPAGRWLALARYGWQLDEGPNARRSAHLVSLHANFKPDPREEWSWRHAIKRGSDRSAGLASRGTAQLAAVRWRHELDARWDLGLGARVLVDSQAAGPAAGLNAEIGYRIAPSLWLSGGFNWLDLRDADLSGGQPLRRGAYLRLRFKFDETLLAGVLPE